MVSQDSIASFYRRFPSHINGVSPFGLIFRCGVRCFIATSSHNSRSVNGVSPFGLIFRCGVRCFIATSSHNSRSGKGDSGGAGWSDLNQQTESWDANPAPGPPPAGSQTRLCGRRAVRSRGVVSRGGHGLASNIKDPRQIEHQRSPSKIPDKLKSIKDPIKDPRQIEKSPCGL
jgi:hypothetical protein